jgi:hypothetical protein
MKQVKNLSSTGELVRWHLALYSAALPPPISAKEPQNGWTNHFAAHLLDILLARAKKSHYSLSLRLQ